MKLFFNSVFLQHLAYGIIIPTLIIWQKQNGLSFTEIALIQSIGLIFLLISELPSSFFADKISRKLAIISGLLITILSFSILIFAKDFILFLLFQILFNIGLAFLSGTEEAFLQDISKKKQKLTHHLGSMSIADELGTMLGLLISSLLIFLDNIILSFQGGFAALILALLLILPIKSNNKHNDHHEKPAQLFSSFSIILIVFIIIFGLFTERGEIIFQSSFNNFGINLEYLGLIYFIAKIFAIIGSKIAGFVEKKLKTLNSLIAAGLIQIIAFAILINNSVSTTIIALCLFFFAENIFKNIKNSFILNNSPHKQRATNLSLISFGSSIMLIFSKLIIGFTLDIKFFYAIIFIISLKIIATILLFSKRYVH